MRWVGSGHIWRTLYPSSEAAKEVISRGAFKVGDLNFVPKGMRSERRKGGMKKHYDEQVPLSKVLICLISACVWGNPSTKYPLKHTHER